MIDPVDTEISRAAAILKRGGLVAIPTETVYGLAANALDETAVARVFEVKDRPRFDPLIVHIADVAQLDEIVETVSAASRKLMGKFWPGPLTLVLPKRSSVPDLVTAGLNTVAVRIPDHAMTLQLLRAANVPIAAPSANPFGCLSPTTAAHVAEQLGDKIDAILDGGPCRVGVESTVLQIMEPPTADQPAAALLRPGGVSVEEIEAIIGPVALPDSSQSAGEDARPQVAPGMLTRHYAPATPLIVTDNIESPNPGSRVGLLTLDSHTSACGFAAIEILSRSGNLTEAAAGFFAALRRLDDQNLDQIIATPFPETGLGRALNDRLRRAAVR